MAQAITSVQKNFLVLNGKSYGVQGYEGGGFNAEVATEKQGPGLPHRKYVVARRFEDFLLETTLNEDVSNMIKKNWCGELILLNGSVVTTDMNFKATYEDVFQEAVLAETIIPACDGASKETALLRLRLKPSFSKIQKADGKLISPLAPSRQKAMLKANFRFELGKLPCSRVLTIDSFSVTVNVDTHSRLDPHPGKMFITGVNFPNLFLTISTADLQPWLNWYEAFVGEGRSNKNDELSGRLVFLAPDRRAELLAIRLENVGIFSLQRMLAPTDAVQRFRVGLYCQQMLLDS